MFFATWFLKIQVNCFVFLNMIIILVPLTQTIYSDPFLIGEIAGFKETNQVIKNRPLHSTALNEFDNFTFFSPMVQETKVQFQVVTYQRL